MPSAVRSFGTNPAILAEVNDLIEKATNLPANNQNQFAIQQEFDRLYRRLRAHEAAENQLLAQGFGMPVNGTEEQRAVTLKF